MMKFFRELVAFCRFLAAGFRKWFMPLPMAELKNVEEEPVRKRKAPKKKKPKPAADLRPASAAALAEASSLTDKQQEVSTDAPSDKQVSSATEEAADEAQTPRRKIIDILTLSNSRRAGHLARGAGLSVEECDSIVKELIEEGVIVQGRAGWLRLTAERRLSLLETNAQLLPALELIRHKDFRREALETLFELLENYRISLQPRRRKVAVIVQSRRAALLAFGPGAITVKLFGAFDKRFVDLVERAGGIGATRDEDSLIFDWRAEMNSAKVASLLRDAFEQRLKTAKSSPSRGRTKSGGQAAKRGHSPKRKAPPKRTSSKRKKPQKK